MFHQLTRNTGQRNWPVFWQSGYTGTLGDKNDLGNTPAVRNLATSFRLVGNENDMQACFAFFHYSRFCWSLPLQPVSLHSGETNQLCNMAHFPRVRTSPWDSWKPFSFANWFWCPWSSLNIESLLTFLKIGPCILILTNSGGTALWRCCRQRKLCYFHFLSRRTHAIHEKVHICFSDLWGQRKIH